LSFDNNSKSIEDDQAILKETLNTLNSLKTNQLKQGSFILLEVANLNSNKTESIRESVQRTIIQIEFLKKNQIHPILCSPDAHLHLIDQWSSHPLVSGYLKSSSQFIPSKTNTEVSSIFTLSLFTGFFTSGTTAQQKVVIHRDSSIDLAVDESLSLLQLEKDDLVLTALPLFHLGGYLQLKRSQRNISRNLFCSPKELTRIWQKERPKAIIGVPTQLVSGIEKKCPETLFYTGGSALPKNLWKQAQELNYKVLSTYGLTESAGAILYQDDPAGKVSIYPSTDIKISNDALLSFKSERLAHAMIKLEKANPEILSKDSFFQTKDRAEICDKIGVKILGRVDDIIICAGENISPSTILSVLKDQKSFQTIFLKGIDHPKLGQIPVLFVDPFPKFQTDDQKKKWIANFKSMFPPLKRPRAIISIPTFSGIKPSKKEFEEHYNNRHEANHYDL
jgi:acyl-coenzyme A synthetase/AMP-(fatty) acid ligase